MLTKVKRYCCMDEKEGPGLILTVTLNPSIDKLYLMDSIRPETVMRVREVHNTAGGKGLNVSRTAAGLGEPVTAAGFIGGFNGQYLESLVDQPLIRCAFTRTASETRCCINCWDLTDGKSTEYLEPGAPVSAEEVGRFLADFDRELAGADVVTISGSIPAGAPETIYPDRIRRCRNAGVPVLVDTSGQRLIDAAAEKPTLIKPNTDEIRQLTGSLPASEAEQAAVTARLHAGGIPYVVLSLGAEGAVMACEAGVFRGCPPRLTPKNTVGCGDAMTAGFAVGIARRLPPEDCFRTALAVSAAGALSLFTGRFETADYERLYPQIEIRKIG